MFLSELRSFPHSLPVTKILFELVMRDHPSFLVLYDTSLATLEGRNRLWKESHPVKIILRYLSEDLKLEESEIGRVGENFSNSSNYFNVDSILEEYLLLAPVQLKVKSTIESTLRKRYRLEAMSDTTWTIVLRSIREHVSKYFKWSNYQPYSEGLVDYLVSGIQKYYLPEIPSEINNLLLSKGLNQEEEGLDYSAIERMKESSVHLEDLKGFTSLAKSIHQASRLLFEHNGAVSYDLFSRYKSNILRDRFSYVKEMVSSSSGGILKFEVLRLVDVNLSIKLRNAFASSDVAEKKLDYRSDLVRPLDRLLLGDSDIKSMFKEMMDTNLVTIQERGGKDKLPLFDGGGYTSRDPLSNSEKQEILLTGFLALNKFIKYLNKNGIDPLSVPSDVFKDTQLSIRLDSFKWYIASLEATKELIAGEVDNAGEGLKPNNILYAAMNIDSSDLFGSIPLNQIQIILEKKTAIEREKSRKTEYLDKELINRAVELFRDGKKNGPKSTTLAQYGAEKFVLSNMPPLKQVCALLESRVKTEIEGIYNPKEGVTVENFLHKIYSLRYPEESMEYRLKMRSAIGVVKVSGMSGEVGVIGYLRVISLVECFLKYIEDLLAVIGPKNYNAITGDFKLMMEFADKDLLLPFPVDFTSSEEVMPILDKYSANLYITQLEGEDNWIIGEQIVRVFQDLTSDFREYLEYCNKMYKTCMSKYLQVTGDKLVTEEVETSLMRKAGIELYRLLPITSPSLTERKKSLIPSKNSGFLMYSNGKYFTKELDHSGSLYYLHDAGYWAVFQDKSYTKHKFEEGSL
jgi:hypothetical protein